MMDDLKALIRKFEARDRRRHLGKATCYLVS